jgi:hypothetical protein
LVGSLLSGMWALADVPVPPTPPVPPGLLVEPVAPGLPTDPLLSSVSVDASAGILANATEAANVINEICRRDPNRWRSMEVSPVP